MSRWGRQGLGPVCQLDLLEEVVPPEFPGLTLCWKSIKYICRYGIEVGKVN
jgi:hypothetical protein